VDKILVIVNKFPPVGGVGARRWAKFVKYFSRNETNCYVLTFKDKSNKLTWDNLVENPHVQITRIKRGYPNILFKSKLFLARAYNKIISTILKQFFFQIDYAQRANNQLIRTAQKILDTNEITTVVVSGPPHSLLFCGAILKIQNPHIKLCLDYRDTWNDEDNYAFPKTIKKVKTKQKSIFMEQSALSVADAVIVVTRDMKQRMSWTYPQYEHKIHVVHNGYDIEDYNLDFPMVQNNRDFVYLGTLNNERKKAVELFAQALDRLELNIKLHLYTDINLTQFRNKSMLPFVKKNVVFHSMVKPTELSEVINRYGFCLSINAKNYPHAFGSKIFDYMVLNKPILHISNGGELFDMLKENKSHQVSTYELEKLNSAILNLMNFQNTVVTNAFSDFSVDKLSDKMKKILD